MKLSGYISFQCDTLGFDAIPFKLSEINQKIDTGQRRPVFLVLEEASKKKKILISDNMGKLKYAEPDFDITQEEFKSKLFELDLAIGIWFNSSTTKLLLVRDIFGFTPLYYIFKPGCFFAFATSLPQLASIKEIRQHLSPNKRHIINYLHAWGFNHRTNSETIFQDVHAVLPGHFLSVSSNNLLEECYLNFRVNHINASSLVEYGTMFRELFSKSLYYLTSGYSQVGMHLSGGLDSSSITCMMNWLYPEKIYNTYYLDPLSEKNEDKFYVEEVLKSINSTHTVVKPEGDFRQIFYNNISNNGQPSIMVSGPVLGSLLRSAAKENSCEILLSGNGGDEIIGHGLDYPLSLFNNKEWEELYKLLTLRSKYGEHPEFNGNWDDMPEKEKGLFYFNNYVFRQAVKNRDFRSIVSLFLNFSNSNTWKYFITIVLELFHKKLIGQRCQNMSLVKQELLNINCTKGPNTFDINSKEGLGIYSWRGIRINEEQTNMDINSVKQFYPFYNKDLYEFSLSVPSALKYNSGLTRGHLRYGMEGILPYSLLKRGGKFSFSTYSNYIARTLYSQSRDYLANGAEVWTFVNKQVFDRSIAALNSKEHSYRSNANTINVFRTISLALWLDWYRKL